MLTIGEHSNGDKITELVLKARKYNDKKNSTRIRSVFNERRNEKRLLERQTIEGLEELHK